MRFLCVNNLLSFTPRFFNLDKSFSSNKVPQINKEPMTGPLG